MDPFQIFKDWYDAEVNQSKGAVPSACCLSTIGLDDYPNARIVSLKEVNDNAFLITGPLHSRKGLEIQRSNKVAITFWWALTQRQVRIQGDAHKILDEIADKYFNERGRDSRIVSVVSRQGRPIEDLEILNSKYAETEIFLEGKAIKRPDDWGGYSISPIRIEFLAFKASRFHERILFEIINGKWEQRQLQP